MRLVVGDTGPLNYLVLIGAAEILCALFERVLVPQAVWDELRHPAAPSVVRTWVKHPTTWLEVRPSPSAANEDPRWHALDAGEREALTLALALKADLLLIDDRDGVAVAHRQGLVVTGALGVLDLAARQHLIDLGDAFTRLKATNFRYRPEILDAVLARHSSPTEK